MGFIKEMVKSMQREKHSTVLHVLIQNQIVMGMETLAYMRREAAGDHNCDAEFLWNMAAAEYLEKHLWSKNEEKVKDIPPAPPQYTNGRKQARYSDYQEYKTQ